MTCNKQEAGEATILLKQCWLLAERVSNESRELAKLLQTQLSERVSHDTFELWAVTRAEWEGQLRNLNHQRESFENTQKNLRNSLRRLIHFKPKD